MENGKPLQSAHDTNNRAIMDLVWRFTKKLKIEISHDATIPLCRYISKEMKLEPQGDIQRSIICSNYDMLTRYVSI